MVCCFLTTIFGRDTRPTQVINVIVSALWCIALSVHHNGCTVIELPRVITTHYSPTVWVLATVVVFGVVGVLTVGRAHQVFKSFGLILGALSQAILANGYVTEYPPLDMQIVVCASLSVWFLLAGLYVFKCEGINE